MQRTVALGQGDGAGIGNIAKLLSDVATAQTQQLDDLIFHLNSTYGRISVGKEETGRYSEFIERTQMETRPKFINLKGNELPLVARDFPEFVHNQKLDLTIYNSIGLVAQGGRLTERNIVAISKVDVNRRNTRSSSASPQPPQFLTGGSGAPSFLSTTAGNAFQAQVTPGAPAFLSSSVATSSATSKPNTGPPPPLLSAGSTPQG